MASSELPFFQAPVPALRHLPLVNEPRRIDAEGQPYVPPPPRNVDRTQHGAALMARIDEIEREVGTQPTLEPGEPPGRVGIPLELHTAWGHEVSADEAHALTTNAEIEVLLAIPERDENGRQRTRLLLHVPYGQLHVLREKFRRFTEDNTGFGNIPNPWIANLEQIARAAVPGLWTDEEILPASGETLWWEFWLHTKANNIEVFRFLAQRFGVALKPGVLKLLDRHVLIGSATKRQLEEALPLLDCLAELRRARMLHLEWTDFTGEEQQEVIDHIVGRLVPPSDDAPAVTLLDTGVNRGHRLLDGLLHTDDNHTIFGDGDASDCCPGDGHGTLSAGLAAFGDLRDILNHSEPIHLSHQLEGVKMIDEATPHAPPDFGYVTQQAVNIAETRHRARKRIFSMPISSEGSNDGRPSSWSAAVDGLAFGSEEPGEPKRLILLSAGNTEFLSGSSQLAYPDENHRCQIENPGQAWNALTVGSITRKIIRETDPESRRLREMAPPEGLSPHSRTSKSWDSHWPIKPEIVLEGGNLATADDGTVARRDSLDLLSTSRNLRTRPIAPFRATSASTALAARLAAEIQADYPTIRPETIRGLMVHSARWNETMLNGTNPYRQGSSANVASILRQYGYGEPDGARARKSASNAVTLFREESLRPFTNDRKLNDCHIHTLPIPSNLLTDPNMGDAIMRVTLSYFIAPSPSANSRMPGSRYRYAGCLLRFDARNVNESEEAFINRVGSIAADEEENGGVNGDQDSPSPDQPRNGRGLNNGRWALGPKLRAKGGSLIHDVWQGPAVDLLTINQIAVYPKKGWWSSRTFNRSSPWYRCNRRSIHYSLIVSIETVADVPLYNEISNILSISIDA
jgi:hypothetical protein